MCGIAGMIAPDATPAWRRKVLTNLLLHSQSRGTDATGIAYIDEEGQTCILKDGVKAAEFVQSDAYKEMVANLPPVVIGHTRQASKTHKGGQILSAAEENANNHPFYSPHTGITMVHNGFVDRDFWEDTVGKPHGLKYPFESTTDSEVIIRVLETILLTRGGTMMQLLDDVCANVAGDYTTAFIVESDPNAIWFTVNSRELNFAYVPQNNAFVFASEASIIKNALTEHTYVYDFMYQPVLPKGLIINKLDDGCLYHVRMVAGEGIKMPGKKTHWPHGLIFEQDYPTAMCKRSYDWHTKMADRIAKAAEGEEIEILIDENDEDSSALVVIEDEREDT